MVGADNNDSRNHIYCFRSSASAQHRSNFPIELFSSIIPCATMSGRNSDYKRTSAWFHHADHHRTRQPFFFSLSSTMHTYAMHLHIQCTRVNDSTQEMTFHKWMNARFILQCCMITLIVEFWKHFRHLSVASPLMQKEIVHHFWLFLIINHTLPDPLLRF